LSDPLYGVLGPVVDLLFTRKQPCVRDTLGGLSRRQVVAPRQARQGGRAIGVSSAHGWSWRRRIEARRVANVSPQTQSWDKPSCACLIVMRPRPWACSGPRRRVVETSETTGKPTKSRAATRKEAGAHSVDRKIPSSYGGRARTPNCFHGGVACGCDGSSPGLIRSFRPCSRASVS